MIHLPFIHPPECISCLSLGTRAVLSESWSHSWKPSSTHLLITHTLSDSPKNTHPRAPCSWFLVCLFFPSPVCFPAFQWRECHHAGMQAELCCFQAKDNPRSLELLVPGTGLVGDLCPLGTPQDVSHGSRGLPRAGPWSSVELILELKPGWAGWLLLEGDGKWS